MISLNKINNDLDIVISDNLDVLLKTNCNFRILIKNIKITLYKVANKEIYLANNNKEAIEIMKFLYKN